MVIIEREMPVQVTEVYPNAEIVKQAKKKKKK